MTKRRWFALGLWAVVIVLIIFAAGSLMGGDKADKAAAENSEPVKQTKTEDAPKIKHLDNFQAFIKEYKNLNADDQYNSWYGQLEGKQVEWSGTLAEIWGSRIVVWGGDNYHGQTWTEISDSEHEGYQTIFVRLKDMDQVKNYKPGDKIKFKGALESRGNYATNDHWKLENAIIVK